MRRGHTRASNTQYHAPHPTSLARCERANRTPEDGLGALAFAAALAVAASHRERGCARTRQSADVVAQPSHKARETTWPPVHPLPNARGAVGAKSASAANVSDGTATAPARDKSARARPGMWPEKALSQERDLMQRRTRTDARRVKAASPMAVDVAQMAAIHAA